VRVVRQTLNRVAGIAIVSFILTLALVLAFDVSALGKWAVRTVDVGWIETYNDLTLDAGDNVGVAYISTASGQYTLAYSRDMGSHWERTPLTVLLAGDVKAAVDSHCRVHVCAITDWSEYWFPQSIMYATNASGNWSLEVMRLPTPAVPRSCAFAVDSYGNPHVVYSQSSNSLMSIRYRANSSGTWNDSELVPGQPEAFYSYYGVESLVCDSKDRLHLVYRETNDYKNESTGNVTHEKILRYATIVGGSFHAIDFPSTCSNAMCVSMAVDEAGVVHFAFYEPTSGFNCTIMHATYDGSSWSFETVADAGECLWYPDSTSLAIDRNGHIHISYYSGQSVWKDGARVPVDRCICYSTNADGAWKTTELDVVGAQFNHCHTSIALDSSIGVHISYFKHVQTKNGDHEYVMYVTNNPGPRLRVSDLVFAYLNALAVSMVASAAYAFQHYARLRKEGYRIGEGAYFWLQGVYWIIALPTQFAVIMLFFVQGDELTAAVLTVLVCVTAELVGYHFLMTRKRHEKSPELPVTSPLWEDSHRRVSDSWKDEQKRPRP
jgi:hypothetical protein